MYISNVNTASIHLMSLSTEVNDDHHLTIQTNKHLTFFYILKGALTYKSEGETTNLKRHDLLIVNPNQQLDITLLRKVEWVRFEVDGIVFTSSYDISADSQTFVVHDNDTIIKKYLELLTIEHAYFAKGTEMILRKLTENIIVHVLRNKGLSIKDSQKQIKHDEIQAVQDYIRKNYTKKLTLDELAETANINKYYFIRLFKQKTGLSPIDYLIHVRLAEAEKLLTETNTSVTEISDQVGFHSPSHFSKTFKESNHITPSQFRKKYRNNED